MDTQRAADELQASGIEPDHARGIVRVMATALQDYPNLDRFERALAGVRAEMAGLRAEMAESRAEMRVEMAKFREEMREEFAKFRLQMIWLVVAGNAATIISLLLAILLKK